MIHEWELTETNLERLSRRKPTLAILATAAVEAHNRHLPEGQDFLHTSWVSRAVAEKAWATGQRLYAFCAGATVPNGRARLCQRLVEGGSGRAAPFRFEALNRGWARTSRRFARLNDHCAAGDRSRASTEKGRAYLDLVVDRLSRFAVELAGEGLDAAFPMQP